MIERRGYKFRLEPSPEQEQILFGFVGSRRWVWNHALGLQIALLDAGQTLLTYNELAKVLTGWRNAPDTEWLYLAPVHTQQATLKDLDRAFKRWRKGGAKLPRFKKKGAGESIRYPDCKQIDFDFNTKDQDGRTVFPKIFLPKLGWVKFRQSRDLVGKVCNVTVSYSAGHWYISVQVEFESSPQPILRTDENTIGGDIGLCHFLVLSDGTEIEKPLHIQKIEGNLAIAQRKLSRMKQGSKNYTKQKKRIQRLHRKVACARRDYLHKKSAEISKNHAYAVLEDANVANMVKREQSVDPSGEKLITVPNAWFNRRLYDVGWAMFLFFLDYKLRQRGGGLILVNPAYSSQECSECSHIEKGNRPIQDRFHCLSCHHDEQADFNAAKVIKKRAGPAQFAHESPSNR